MRGATKEQMNKINKATRFVSGEKAVESGRKGGQKSQKVQKTKRTLRMMFEETGNTIPPETVKEQLAKLGYDVDDLVLIDALVKFASIKTMDKKTSLTEIYKFIELYAKYTGQEPAQEVNAKGFNILVADKNVKDAFEDL